MASPSPDIGFTFTFTGASVGSSLSHAAINPCSASNELVLAIIGYEESSGSAAVSSVTESSSTLTFTFLTKIPNPTAGAHNETIEVWAAKSTGQFNSGSASITYTVNWSAIGVDDAVVVMTAVESLHSLSAPLDPSTTIPASAFNTTNTTPPTVTFSTVNPDDLLIGITASAVCNDGSTAPSGWSSLAGSQNCGGLNAQGMSVYYKSVSATQNSATYRDGAAVTTNSWTALVLAFTADANATNSLSHATLVGF